MVKIHNKNCCFPNFLKYFKSDYVCSSMYTVLLGAASPAHSLPYSLSNANEFTVGPLCRLLLAAHSGTEWLKSATKMADLQTFLTNSQQFCSRWLNVFHINKLSICCWHEYDWSISRFFIYFWRVLTMWHNCATAGTTLYRTVSYRARHFCPY